MEYIISINDVKVKTVNRICIFGYILWSGKTETKCKFDYIGTDIENWNSTVTLSNEEKMRLKDALKEKFGFGNYYIKNINNEIAKDIQVRFKSD